MQTMILRFIVERIYTVEPALQELALRRLVSGDCLDKRDAEKVAARQAKKDARLRERKRRLLMKQIEQAKKDAAVLEKYIKRLEKRQSGKDALILQTVK